MKGWSCRAAAGAVAFMLALGQGSASAQSRRIAVFDAGGLRGEGVTRHVVDCGGCAAGSLRAGIWRRSAAVPDYRQALPIYQPPAHTHPPHVMRVRSGLTASGAYAVTGAPWRPARDPEFGVWSGASPRIITLRAAGRGGW